MKIQPLKPVGLCLIAMLCIACGAEEQAERDAESALKSSVGKSRMRNGNLSRAGFAVKSFDLDRDEKPDQWILTRSGEKRVERDLNFDGRVDMWQYTGKDGSIAEEEMDLDLDGKVDLVVYYDKGVVTRKEISVDFSGKFAIVKFYDDNGVLLRIERDENNDGAFDVWEYYEKGQRVRIGWDTDEDGEPDTFDTLK